MKIVVKFGGTSLATVKDIKNVVKTVDKIAKKNKTVVVCSAVDGITDELIEISSLVEKGKKKDANRMLAKISQKHKQFAEHLISNPKTLTSLKNKINSDLSELEELVRGLILLGEVTPRSYDYLISFGERLSIDLVSFSLQEAKNKSVPLNGKEAGIVTDSNFGDSRPLMDTTRIRLSKTINEYLNKNTIPVVAGFAGADQNDHTTTFGRGGSDYTATIIASCIDADEVWLMSDVEGLMTADPKLVKNAKLIKQVSYSEAIEMARFGAKQIHPRTFEPLLPKKRQRTGILQGPNSTVFRGCVVHCPSIGEVALDLDATVVVNLATGHIDQYYPTERKDEAEVKELLDDAKTRGSLKVLGMREFLLPGFVDCHAHPGSAGRSAGLTCNICVIKPANSAGTSSRKSLRGGTSASQTSAKVSASLAP